MLLARCFALRWAGLGGRRFVGGVSWRRQLGLDRDDPAALRGERDARRRARLRPTGTTRTAVSGTSSIASSPTVPWPAIVIGSSNGWTSARPVCSISSCRRSNACVGSVRLEVDLRPVGARRLDLLRARALPHDEQRVDALERGAVGERLCVVSRRDADHAVPLLGLRERGELRQDAARLERARALEELGLQVDGRADLARTAWPRRTSACGAGAPRSPRGRRGRRRVRAQLPWSASAGSPGSRARTSSGSGSGTSRRRRLRTSRDEQHRERGEHDEARPRSTASRRRRSRSRPARPGRGRAAGRGTSPSSPRR